MTDPAIACADARVLGRSLRVWRTLKRIKQAAAAEMLGVSQGVVSRWESGRLAPGAGHEQALRRLMGARLDSAADFELARLVKASNRAVHLICDLTHRLLALSPRREAQLRVPASALVGTSLWGCASPEIVAAEARLPELGWFEPNAPAVESYTGPKETAALIIPPSRFRWVRFQLSDGAFARLVETVDEAPARA
ncbi:MAG: helix-turn-helix transcriptional regulator [Pseudomonadota bacterium]|nr:helix-turn-helix transcriptional regulator [Pseudomonadota bacterium]